MKLNINLLKNEKQKKFSFLETPVIFKGVISWMISEYWILTRRNQVRIQLLAFGFFMFQLLTAHCPLGVLPVMREHRPEAGVAWKKKCKWAKNVCYIFIIGFVLFWFEFWYNEVVWEICLELKVKYFHSEKLLSGKMNILVHTAGKYAGASYFLTVITFCYQIRRNIAFFSNLSLPLRSVTPNLYSEFMYFSTNVSVKT